MNNTTENKSPWYHGVTRYQWMVLAIASAGWVFDVFEGQIFGACMNKAIPEFLPGTSEEIQAARERVVNLGLGAFLLGGALGGVWFGMLADRWGRRAVMAITILMYSIFTGLTFFAQNEWHLIGLRFFVGMGVGGEWAVAAAVVAEVFPQRARPIASGIFHASSVLGTYLAVLTGFLIVANPYLGWRYGFLVGVLPALLILWVRVSMKEPETWKSAQKQSKQAVTQRLGRFMDLFSTPQLRRNTFIGVSLGIIGLATFWGTHFRGKDVLRQARLKSLDAQIKKHKVIESALIAQLMGLAGSPGGVLATTTALPPNREAQIYKTLTEPVIYRYEMIGMFLVTTGGGIGLLSFAPISQRFGRRGAFIMFHLAGFAMVGIVFFLANSVMILLFVLPIFGFFTLAMHAGYAVYFPELYPTRMRGTGAGFCFNMARLVTVPVLLVFAWLQGAPLLMSLPASMLVLSGLFLVGAGVSWMAPETRNLELPE